MRLLNHIALAVRDPVRSSRFYRDLLRLDGAIREEVYGTVMLTTNGLVFAFLARTLGQNAYARLCAIAGPSPLHAAVMPS